MSSLGVSALAVAVSVGFGFGAAFSFLAGVLGVGGELLFTTPVLDTSVEGVTAVLGRAAVVAGAAATSETVFVSAFEGRAPSVFFTSAALGDCLGSILAGGVTVLGSLALAGVETVFNSFSASASLAFSMTSSLVGVIEGAFSGDAFAVDAAFPSADGDIVALIGLLFFRGVCFVRGDVAPDTFGDSF